MAPPSEAVALNCKVLSSLSKLISPVVAEMLTLLSKTVIEMLAELPFSTSAVMVQEPTPLAVTVPRLTVATFLSEVVQVTLASSLERVNGNFSESPAYKLRLSLLKVMVLVVMEVSSQLVKETAVKPKPPRRDKTADNFANFFIIIYLSLITYIFLFILLLTISY